MAEHGFYSNKEWHDLRQEITSVREQAFKQLEDEREERRTKFGHMFEAVNVLREGRDEIKQEFAKQAARIKDLERVFLEMEQGVLAQKRELLRVVDLMTLQEKSLSTMMKESSRHKDSVDTLLGRAQTISAQDVQEELTRPTTFEGPLSVPVHDLENVCRLAAGHLELIESFEKSIKLLHEDVASQKVSQDAGMDMCWTPSFRKDSDEVPAMDAPEDASNFLVKLVGQRANSMQLSRQNLSFAVSNVAQNLRPEQLGFNPIVPEMGACLDRFFDSQESLVKNTLDGKGLGSLLGILNGQHKDGQAESEAVEEKRQCRIPIPSVDVVLAEAQQECTQQRKVTEVMIATTKSVRDSFTNVLQGANEKNQVHVASHESGPDAPNLRFGGKPGTLCPTEDASADGKSMVYLADNSILGAKSPGLGFRTKPSMDDVDPNANFLPWGSFVYGTSVANGDWLKAGERYLPMKLNGAEVLRRSTVHTDTEVASKASTKYSRLAWSKPEPGLDSRAGITSCPNENVPDSMPDWVKSLLETMIDNVRAELRGQAAVPRSAELNEQMQTYLRTMTRSIVREYVDEKGQSPRAASIEPNMLTTHRSSPVVGVRPLVSPDRRSSPLPTSREGGSISVGNSACAPVAGSGISTVRSTPQFSGQLPPNTTPLSLTPLQIPRRAGRDAVKPTDCTPFSSRNTVPWSAGSSLQIPPATQLTQRAGPPRASSPPSAPGLALRASSPSNDASGIRSVFPTATLSTHSQLTTPHSSPRKTLPSGAVRLAR